MGALALCFAAGCLAILSPCVLPLAPIVIAASRAEGFAGPFALAGGLALSFAAVGAAMAAAGLQAGDSVWLRGLAAAALAVSGVVLLSPRLQLAVEGALAPLTRASGALERRLPAGLIGQGLLGAALALAWAPCAGPTLGAAFALAAGGGSNGFAFAAMAAYALGASGALMAAGFGLGRLAGRARLARAASVGRVAFGGCLLAVGLAVPTGFDHWIEARAVAAAPDWLTALATRL